MDWEFDGVEFEEESKLREETRKILELPELPISRELHARPGPCRATRRPFGSRREEPLSAEAATASARICARPSPRRLPDARRAPPGSDDVLVGRVRRDPAPRTASALLVVADNLRKGAALNAIQIAELLLDRARAAA